MQRLLVVSVISAVLGLAVPAASSAAVIYDNTPSPLPGNLPSLGYEATSTSEFGGQVAFAGTARTNPTISVVMSSWGCESGTWSGGDCTTSAGATFSHPITLSVYDVNTDGTPGAQIATTTQTFDIPYRPSASPGCGDGRWQDAAGDCFNGLATTITFAPLDGVVLPDKAIVSIAYNTSHYGAAPIGTGAACYSESGGCGYDSLNVALTAPPSVGTDPQPDDAYLDSTWGGAYCDGGTGGTGSFRLDAGCWTGYQPAIEVEAPVGPPTSADQCKKDGWRSFDTPRAFKNQGDCVSSVATAGKKQ